VEFECFSAVGFFDSWGVLVSFGGLGKMEVVLSYSSSVAVREIPKSS